MAVTLLLPLTLIADTVADAVRVELALELGRIDVAVSTRATPADLEVTVTGSPNAHVEVGP